MAGQTPAQSLAETVGGTVLGLAVGIVASLYIYPFHGVDFSLADNATITLEFAAVSFVRGYLWRRLCNWYFGRTVE